MRLRKKIAFGLSAFYLLSLVAVVYSLLFGSYHLPALEPESANLKSYVSVAHKSASKKQQICKNTQADTLKTECKQPPTKVQTPKKISITLFFGPMLVEFLEYLLPPLFAKIEHQTAVLSSNLSSGIYSRIFNH